MSKKLLAFILAVAMAGTMTACGNKKEESDLEGWDQKSFEELEKEYEKEQEEEKESKAAKEQAEQEAAEQITDFSAQDIYVEDIDPYEKNIFAVMGLDNNFPKPKDTVTCQWNYETSPSESTQINSTTGDPVQPLPFRKLWILSNSGDFYTDYFSEVHEYLNSKSSVKHDMSNTFWNGYWLEDGSKKIATNKVDGWKFLVTSYDTTKVHIEGTVTSVAFGDRVSPTECPTRLGMTIDSQDGTDRTDIANMKEFHVGGLYNQEGMKNTDPTVTFVGAEGITKGSKISIDMTVAEGENPMSYVPGENFVDCTITLLQ